MVKGLKEVFGVTGLSLGMGILGESFNSEGLKQGSETASKFISPMINISMGGFVLDQLKSLKKI